MEKGGGARGARTFRPTGARIKAAESAGNLTVQPVAGVTTLTIKNYLKQGDLLDDRVRPQGNGAQELHGQFLYVDKPKEDDLALAVTFAQLTDGTSYPAQVVLDVKAKNVQVKIANSGYKKAGP